MQLTLHIAMFEQKGPMSLPTRNLEGVTHECPPLPMSVRGWGERGGRGKASVNPSV